MMGFASLHPSYKRAIVATLDATRQISAFVKLKLTSCAWVTDLAEIGFLIWGASRPQGAIA
jgi:hypothetical protein